MTTRRVTRIEHGFSGAMRIPYTLAWLGCGHAARTGAVGDLVECEPCAVQERQVVILRDLIAEGGLSHSRSKPWCGVNQIHVYRFDPDSPTGVRLAVTVDDTPETEALLRGGLSPLSPTEAR